MKKRFFLLLPLFALTLSGCDFLPNSIKNIFPWGKDESTDEEHHDEEQQDEEEEDSKISVTGVTLNPKSLSLTEGETSTLSYTIFPTNADNKNVEWSTSNEDVASIENGVVKAWNEGTATITITTVDSGMIDTCDVTVTKAGPVEKEIETKFDLNTQNYPDSYHNKSLINMNLECQGEYTISFAVGGNTYNNNPTLILNSKLFEARVYWGNTFAISSKTVDMVKIKFDLSTNDKGNDVTSSTGTFNNNVWEGNAKSVTFTVSGTSGYKAIKSFSFYYLGTTSDDPDTPLDLGEKTISEVKQYIADHPVNKNSFGNGVNENRRVTIKGFALAKIDLIKYTSKFGLDVSEHGKVILADNTGSIACATVVNNLGTSLWGKIGDYVCKPTSKYIVTGYISEYLGHPEILVTSFTWDQSLDISWSSATLSSGAISLTEFYTKAANVNYNCAGHGYGDVVTIKDLTCYYVETDGQGKRYYNMTNGTQNIRINAFNIDNCTVGNTYDVTGIILLKNLSPIIIAFEIKSSAASAVSIDYKSVSTAISISQLNAIHGSQDDTSERYPNVVNAYGTIYKTSAYMCVIDEGGKYYVGICDTYHEKLITGKTNAMANYNVLLIKNENFWNVSEYNLMSYNPYYEDYIFEQVKVDVYYVVRQQEYSDKKAYWEILLLPESLPELVK